MMDTVYHNPPGNAREKRELRSIIPLNRESCFACARTRVNEGIRTFRAGEEEESPAGDSECLTQAADKRTLKPGPLVNHPAPEDEERIPRLWTPHLLQCAYLDDFAPLLNGVWSNGGWNKFHLAYRMLIYRGPSP